MGLGTRLLIGILFIVGLFWLSALFTPSPPPSPTPATTRASTTPAVVPTQPAAPVLPPPAALAILSARSYKSETASYWYVEGLVKNISDQSLNAVAAVVTWYDKNGDFIASDRAVIDYNPILPGQTSPFETITGGNPAMAKFSIGFQNISGETIATRDDRKSSHRDNHVSVRKSP